MIGGEQGLGNAGSARRAALFIHLPAPTIAGTGSLREAYNLMPAEARGTAGLLRGDDVATCSESLHLTQPRFGPICGACL